MKLKDLILDRLEVSIAEFCRDIKVTRGTIYSIINESTTKPTRAVVVKVCKYFNVDFKDYL